MNKDQPLDNQWLARALWDLGAVTFGDFTLGGSTVNSPVFINPKLLISNPMALSVATKLMVQEIELAQSLRRSRSCNPTMCWPGCRSAACCSRSRSRWNP